MKDVNASVHAGFRGLRTNADSERTKTTTKTGCGRTRTNTIVCPVCPVLSADVQWGEK